MLGVQVEPTVQGQGGVDLGVGQVDLGKGMNWMESTCGCFHVVGLLSHLAAWTLVQGKGGRASIGVLLSLAIIWLSLFLLSFPSHFAITFGSSSRMARTTVEFSIVTPGMFRVFFLTDLALELVCSWARFTPRVVLVELSGAEHTKLFAFEEVKLSVSIPTLEYFTDIIEVKPACSSSLLVVCLTFRTFPLFEFVGKVRAFRWFSFLAYCKFS